MSEAVNVCNACGKPCKVTEWCNSECCAESVTPRSHETQATITKWCEETFGEVSSNFDLATRVNEEMAEMLAAFRTEEGRRKVPEEAADVVITITRLATRLGAALDFTSPSEGSPRFTAKRWAILANMHAAAILDRLERDDDDPTTAGRICDLVWECFRAGEASGVNLQDAIDAKMRVNRYERKWRRDGTGQGYHIRADKQEGQS